ncbi:hypothetical protein CTAYLR_003029 [Chrysophaeum taylorii]|uniref:Uncharacterized protein n=1 Tax=Chrysophaeum taylorii TaxID=2483200 RepID=A0AAD7XEN7_9STRA|nr:hypothetical protein CTAYLR_003029 [Chrysophaeum taylorii]
MVEAVVGWEASPFHEGEWAVQEKLGVREQMEVFARKVVRRYMNAQHREFYGLLDFVIVGYEEGGWPWCTILTGKAGFIETPDPLTMKIRTRNKSFSPKIGTRLGLLGIQLSTRRRNRLAATVRSVDEDGLTLGVDQSFGNCPQYIQLRETSHVVVSSSSSSSNEKEAISRLGDRERALIAKSDTLFVASCVPGEGVDRGADASHRGGRQGFCHVAGETRLSIPDFPGNNHYNTLGNFWVNPKAGLLFVDFENGDMLQLVGTVELEWEGDAVETFKGADRLWHLEMSEGKWSSVDLRWQTLPHYWSPNSLMTGVWEEAEAALRAKRKRESWRPFEVVETVAESADITSFYLAPKDGDSVLGFQAGQFLTIKIPCDVTPKNWLVRTYTVSNAPDEADFYRISVKRDGVASGILHDKFTTRGASLETKAPRGAFTFDAADPRPAVLLAGGVGVTPMISMLRHGVREGHRMRYQRKCFFITSFRTEGQRAFHKEALELKASARDPDAITVVSLISSKDGRLSKKILQAILPLDDYHYFLCGPPSFSQAVYDILRNELGARDASIFSEAFGPASIERVPDDGAVGVAADQPPAAASAHVVFARSKFEIQWTPKDGTLLDLAEMHGIQPDFGCRLGNCGTCLAKINNGAVTYAGYNTPVYDIEDTSKFCLICQAVPAVDTLELDL